MRQVAQIGVVSSKGSGELLLAKMMKFETSDRSWFRQWRVNTANNERIGWRFFTALGYFRRTAT